MMTKKIKEFVSTGVCLCIGGDAILGIQFENGWKSMLDSYSQDYLKKNKNKKTSTTTKSVSFSPELFFV